MRRLHPPISRTALAAGGKPGHIIRVDRARREGYSIDHVLHEVLTTEFMLMVWESAAANDDLELLRVERRSIPSQPALKVALRRKMTRLEPDALFLYRQKTKTQTLRRQNRQTGEAVRHFGGGVWAVRSRQLPANGEAVTLKSVDGPVKHIRDCLDALLAQTGAHVQMGPARIAMEKPVDQPNRATAESETQSPAAGR